jgi:hypothetical protein
MSEDSELKQVRGDALVFQKMNGEQTSLLPQLRIDPTKSGKGTRAAYNKIREIVPMIREDRILSGDIETLAGLVSDGSILQAVDAAIGPLQ